MTGKRGAIELSMNFIVTLIITLVVFSAGIYIFNKIGDSSLKKIDEAQDQWQRKMEQLKCDNSEKVCIPSAALTVKRGELVGIPLKIYNPLESGVFNGYAKFTGKVYKDGVLCTNPTCDYGQYGYRSGDNTGTFDTETDTDKKTKLDYGTILPNTDRTHIIGIVISGGESGLTYVFDVYACAGFDTKEGQAKCSSEYDFGNKYQLWITVK